MQSIELGQKETNFGSHFTEIDLKLVKWVGKFCQF